MTTYRSESRGFMYTAPPSGDEENRTRPKTENAEFAAEDDATEDAPENDAASDGETESEVTAEGERGSPTLEPTSATTDANWTGTVPADD